MPGQRLPGLVCIECGSDNACHCKVLGPTLGFLGGILAYIVCIPASLFCGCCATERGKKTLGMPRDVSRDISDAIPF